MADTVGDGSKLFYSLDGTTFTVFAKIVDIDGNEIEAPEVDTNQIDSVAHESQPGIPDYGEFSVRVKFQAANVTLVRGWVDSKAVIWIKAQVQDTSTSGSSDKVKCWVKKFNAFGTLKENELVESMVTFRTTGAGTFTAGT